MQHTELLFVYGTMRRGERNHWRLRGCEFLGERLTANAIWHMRTQQTLHGYAPVVFPNGKHRIRGELYRVPVDKVELIDLYEGHPEVYRRIKLRLFNEAERAHAYIWVKGTKGLHNRYTRETMGKVLEYKELAHA